MHFPTALPHFKSCAVRFALAKLGRPLHGILVVIGIDSQGVDDHALVVVDADVLHGAAPNGSVSPVPCAGSGKREDGLNFQLTCRYVPATLHTFIKSWADTPPHQPSLGHGGSCESRMRPL